VKQHVRHTNPDERSVPEETYVADDNYEVVEEHHEVTPPESTRVVYIKERSRSGSGLGWLLLVIVVALLVIWQLDNITAALHLQSSAISNQTSATREQTGVLSGIQQAINTLTQAVRDGVRQLSARSQ
jgi:hypothetical protein